MIKLSVNETKWSSSQARTRALIFYILIWIFDFGPEKLPGRSGTFRDVPGRSRNGPQLDLSYPKLSPPQGPLCVVGRLGRNKKEARGARWEGGREKRGLCHIVWGCGSVVLAVVLDAFERCREDNSIKGEYTQSDGVSILFHGFFTVHVFCFWSGCPPSWIIMFRVINCCSLHLKVEN